LDPAFETLKTASRADLIDAWREAIGRPAPKHISRSLLITVLSFEQQAKQYGRPNQRFRQALERHVSGKASKPKLHSGTRFIREHHGKTHIVEVDAAGAFIWQGKSFASLSQVAKQICGYHCSGHKFFGVTK
jgi:hypothetical protein